MGYKESIYEMLVWEYLELVKGYFVKMDERYKRCGEGDIDVIAVRIEDRKIVDVIVGEVVSITPDEDDIDEFIKDIHSKLEELREKLCWLSALIEKPRIVLYCWFADEKTKTKIREYANSKGIEVEFFDDIIVELVNFLVDYKKKCGKDNWFHDRKYMLTWFLQLVLSSLKDKFKSEEKEIQELF